MSLIFVYFPAFVILLVYCLSSCCGEILIHKILCVGDSITFGAGSSNTEHSYPSLLQDKLNVRMINHRFINILNKETTYGATEGSRQHKSL